jgi:hypothetical protein
VSGDVKLGAGMTGLTRQVALAATAAPAVVTVIRLGLTRALLDNRKGTRRCLSSGSLIDERAREDRTRSVG